MRVGRRSFLKLLGGTAATAAAAVLSVPTTAPLFVPPDRLDYGVPRQILTATEMPLRTTEMAWTNTFLQAEEIQTIIPIPATEMSTGLYSGVLRQDSGLLFDPVPMLLLHDELRPPGWQQYGRQRVPAGTTLLVDRETTERWAVNGVAAATPDDIQQAGARRLAEQRQAADPYRWVDAVERTHEEYDLWAAGAPPQRRAAPDALEQMVTRASERAKRESTALAWWDDLEPAPWGVGNGMTVCHFGDDDAT